MIAEAMCRQGARTTAAKIALPNPNERCLAFGHYRGRNRIFAYRALANRIFTQGVFADWRSHWLRLRPWEVGSNCCSHEGQRSQADDHKLQHQILPHCESRWNLTKVKLDPTMATMNGTEELAVRKAVFCRMLRKWHEIRGAWRRSRRSKGGRSTGPRRASVSFCPDA